MRKKTEGVCWGSVDDSDRRDKARKEDKTKANAGKSTAQLLSELYGEADDDAKKKLESAWEAGRARREKAVTRRSAAAGDASRRSAANNGGREPIQNAATSV